MGTFLINPKRTFVLFESETAIIKYAKKSIK